VIPALKACAECIYEEDREERDSLCQLVPPVALRRAGDLVRLEGSVAGARGPRAVLRWLDGTEWAVLTSPWFRRREDAAGLRQVEHDLAKLSLVEFVERHGLRLR